MIYIPIELKYNNLTNIINFNKNYNLGILQEIILNKFNLIIFNIEHSKIFINNESYIVGNEENPFDMKLTHAVNPQIMN